MRNGRSSTFPGRTRWLLPTAWFLHQKDVLQRFWHLGCSLTSADLRRDQPSHCHLSPALCNLSPVFGILVFVCSMHGAYLPEPTCPFIKAYDDSNFITQTVAHLRCRTIIVPDHHDNRDRTRRGRNTGNSSVCPSTLYPRHSFCSFPSMYEHTL